VLVVDNDTRQSALPIVERARKRLEIDIAYRTEPEQNIALARNAAVKYSGETDIAFIDDDEVPDKRWLLNLWKTLSQSEADGVLGPVRPFFPEGCPAWVAASGLCERPSHATGSVLEVGDCRTGNVLLRRRLFKDGRLFGPEFGRTGGEDAEFFKACIEAGSQFIWCDMAVARETVPPERWTVRYYLRKGMRIGVLTGEKIRSNPIYSRSMIALSLLAVAGYTVFLPFCLLGGRGFFVRHLAKSVYHLGRVLGFAGFSFLRERNDG